MCRGLRNSCLPRPLGTSWPSPRNSAYLHAQPDLTMCGTTHHPWTARTRLETRPQRLVTAHVPAVNVARESARLACPPRERSQTGYTTCKCESPTTSFCIRLYLPRVITSASYPPASAALPRTPCTHGLDEARSLVPHVQITASRRLLGHDKMLPVVSFAVLSGVCDCEGTS